MGIFADDTKIYRPIISPTDYNILQSDINSVLQWCDIWLSFLNYSKCHYNSIGPALSDRQYYLYTHPISFVFNEKDLGVTFDKDLKFTDHINQIVQKENAVLGIIMRTFACRGTLCTVNGRLLMCSMFSCY